MRFNNNVRLTEYTDGRNGPDAMPAVLPASSAYTYAVELSVDEAVAAGATKVTFDRLVVLYLENYRQFTHGHLMPLGYYDRERGAWVPMHDGVIVKVLGIEDGMARLDVDGDNIEDPLSYPVIGISDVERHHVGSLYAPGQTLWRVALDHFTPADINAGMIADEECIPGNESSGCGLKPPRTTPAENCPNTVAGSVIECENQLIRQRIPIVGTPYALHYGSDRAPGREAAYHLEIPIIGTQGLPSGIQEVLVEVKVAGRREKWLALSCPTDPACQDTDVVEEWTWDGIDAWGRRVQGPQLATVRVGYTFTRHWWTPPIVVGGGSGGGGGGGGGGSQSGWLGGPQTGPVNFTAWPEDASFTTEDNGCYGCEVGCLWGCVYWAKYAVWSTSRVGIGAWSTVPLGLGGFSIDVHHGYSPSHRTLFRGDGGRRSDTGKGALIETFAGGGAPAGFVNGGPALENDMIPRGIVAGPDGTMYLVSDEDGNRGVRRITPDANDYRLTAPSGNCTAGNGGPASNAHVCYPVAIARGPDGSLFVAEANSQANTNWVRRIDNQNPPYIWAFAGTGVLGQSGDGGLATNAQLGAVRSVAVAPNGDVYIAHDGVRPAVRRVNTAGLIFTVAGGCTTCSNPSDPFPKLATTIQLFDPAAVAVGTDGSLYIADRTKAVVYRVRPDGYAEYYAGTYESAGTSGDLGNATDATLQNPTELAIANDGTLYIGVEDASVELLNQKGVRRVSPDGKISTIVGNKLPNSGTCAPSCGIPGLAAAAVPDENGTISGLALGPDGNLYAAFTNARRIYRVKPSLPGVGIGDFMVPSEDGREVYVFDEQGRHLVTRDSVTGNALHTFHYRDEPSTPRDKLLWKIASIDGLETLISHDTNGQPTQISGPYGHNTSLSAPDTNGFITTIQPPLVPSYVLSYSATDPGLLLSFTNPKGNQKSYTYTDGNEANSGGLAGMLETTTHALGTRTFTRTLVSTTAGEGFDVALKTAENVTTTYRSIEKPDGSNAGTVFFPDGTQRLTENGINGITTIELDDGTITTIKRSADPRFDLQAPIPEQLKIETGGKTLEVRTARAVTLANASDPLSVQTWTEATCINGTLNGTNCSSTVGGLKTVFTSPADTVTRTTNALRESVTQLNADGRPISVEVTSSVIDVADVALSYNDGSIDPLKKGQLETVTYSFGTESRTYVLTHDSSGNLQSIEDPLNRVVTFTPDGATRIVSQTFPDTNVVGFGYDNNSNLTSVDPPGQGTSNQHAFDFNGVDFLDKYTAPNVGLSSHDNKYLYNGDRQLDLVTFNNLGNASTINPVYDTYGRLDKIHLTPHGGTLWTLDYGYYPSTNPNKGKLASIESTKDGVTLDFSYNGVLVTNVSWSGPSLVPSAKSVTYGYDNALRITSETITGQAATNYVYGDADGLLTQAGALTLNRDADTGLLTDTSMTDGTATITDDIAANPFGELDTYTARWDADGVPGGEVTKYHVDYDRDALGRVIRKAEAVGGGSTEYFGYEYDTAGRLWKVYEGTSPCNPLSSCILQATYTYDANGNRNPSTCSYDFQDRLTSCGTTTYLYTEWGALKQKTVSSALTTYEYDLLGSLRKVTPPSPAQPIEYVMDGLGRRVGRKEGGTLGKVWLYRNALNPVAELDGSGNVQAIFVYGSKSHVPDYMVKNGSRYRFITDELGSVRLVVKVSDGTVAQRIDYDEWGNATLLAGTWDFQPFGFAGGLYDTATGLVRFGLRDYDPAIGRWTSKDPILFRGRQANLYGYVASDPINNIDPTGLLNWALEGSLGGYLGFGATLGLSILYTDDYGFSVFLVQSQGVGVGKLAASLTTGPVLGLGHPSEYGGDSYAIFGGPGGPGLNVTGTTAPDSWVWSPQGGAMTPGAGFAIADYIPLTDVDSLFAEKWISGQFEQVCY